MTQPKVRKGQARVYVDDESEAILEELCKEIGLTQSAAANFIIKRFGKLAIENIRNMGTAPAPTPTIPDQIAPVPAPTQVVMETPKPVDFAGFQVEPEPPAPVTPAKALSNAQKLDAFLK